MSRRKRAIAYARYVLTDPASVLDSTRRFARARKLVVADKISEGNSKQPKLRRLLAGRGTPRTIVTPSMFHLCDPRQLPHVLLEAYRRGFTLIFVRERLTLRQRDANSKLLMTLIEQIVEAHRYSKHQSIRQGLMISRLLGKQIGRMAMNGKREEILRLLQEGNSYSQAAKQARVSKSLVAKVAREQGLRRGDRRSRKPTS